MTFQSPRERGRGCEAEVDHVALPRLRDLFQSPRERGRGCEVHHCKAHTYDAILRAFQSPRERGRGCELKISRNRHRLQTPRFNPLVSGAGAASDPDVAAEMESIRTEFQSPRERGPGCEIQQSQPLSQRFTNAFQSPCERGPGCEEYFAQADDTSFHLVSIPL